MPNANARIINPAESGESPLRLTRPQPLYLVPSGTITATSSTVWNAWNEQYISTSGTLIGSTAVTAASTTVSGTNNIIVWKRWVTEHHTNSATTLNLEGDVVVSDGTASNVISTTGNVTIWTGWIEDQNLSREERDRRAQEHLRRNQEYEAQRIQVEGERKMARERAAQLLQEALSERQRLEMAEKGFFSLTVHDSKTKEQRHYRIRKGRSGNVEQIDANGNRLKGFCIHPIMACPDEDTMLAQKLMLETQEDEFLRVANHRL